MTVIKKVDFLHCHLAGATHAHTACRQQSVLANKHHRHMKRFACFAFALRNFLLYGKYLAQATMSNATLVAVLKERRF